MADRHANMPGGIVLRSLTALGATCALLALGGCSESTGESLARADVLIEFLVYPPLDSEFYHDDYYVGGDPGKRLIARMESGEDPQSVAVDTRISDDLLRESPLREDVELHAEN